MLSQMAAVLRGLTRPGTYVGTARELVVGSFHLAAYPLGLGPLRGQLDGHGEPRDRRGAPLLADQATARIPVVLVHGYVHNRSAFLIMNRALRRAGFRSLHAFAYHPFSHGLPELAALLAAEVERILAAEKAERCMLVGHSMGGMIARTYVQELGGEDTADTVVTLGSPHRGTYTAYAGFGPAAVQLRPGSEFLRRLENGARPSRVRWVAFHSDLDAAIVPSSYARLEPAALQAVNVQVRDTGHTSLLLTGEVLRGVVQFLANPALGRPSPPPRLAALPSQAQRQRRPIAPQARPAAWVDGLTDLR